jgi:hypothetical protein
MSQLAPPTRNPFKVPASLREPEGGPPIGGELTVGREGLRFAHASGETEIPSARLTARCGGFNDSVLFLTDSHRPERIITCHTPVIWHPLAPELPPVAKALQSATQRRHAFWLHVGGLGALLTLIAITMAAVAWLALSTVLGRLF